MVSFRLRALFLIVQEDLRAFPLWSWIVLCTHSFVLSSAMQWQYSLLPSQDYRIPLYTSYLHVFSPRIWGFQ
jgi:hypothetical protein